MEIGNLKKGSFTVEAACMMSIILVTIMGLLFLCFHVHNKSWLTEAAWEAALTGSMEGVKREGKAEEKASLQSRMLGNTGFYGGQNLQSSVSAGKTVSVAYDMDTISEFGNFNWHIHAEAESKVIRPVEWIRKVKAAAELIGGSGE
ncbi:MAG: pilus assembly protein [Blautia sp.]|nr:pilus assembly protein [Blautia sp.]